MSKRKTFINWIKLLPEGYRQKALANKNTTFGLQNSMANAIAGAFEWRTSPEGYDWWKQVHDFYTGENPSLPPLA